MQIILTSHSQEQVRNRDEMSVTIQLNQSCVCGETDGLLNKNSHKSYLLLKSIVMWNTTYTPRQFSKAGRSKRETEVHKIWQGLKSIRKKTYCIVKNNIILKQYYEMSWEREKFYSSLFFIIHYVITLVVTVWQVLFVLGALRNTEYCIQHVLPFNTTL